MQIKKNVPYKALRVLWVITMVLLVFNIVTLWLAWEKREAGDFVKSLVTLGVVSGCFTLAFLIATAVVAFLNQKTEVRVHVWAYGLMAVIHLVFVILTFTIDNTGNNSLPALFTVFLVAIMAVMVYFALAGKRVTSAFSRDRHNKEDELAPIHREDLGSNPTEAIVDQVANPENNPDRKAGRDEKTGIVSL